MLPPLIRLLRPHQWAKNLLVLTALFTAHRVTSAPAWQAAGWMLLAFCLGASAIYVINDALDYASDRQHPDKSKRPFASGAISRQATWWLVPLLLIGAAAPLWQLPSAATHWWLAYILLSVAYSLWLKRLLWLDVVVLAGLYVLRIAAGASAIEVPLSAWLSGFALFLFLSLAMLKRFGELAMSDADTALAGRAYRRSDAPVVLAFGAAAALTALVVLALYVQSADVRRLYAEPQYLLTAVPLFLYWLARLWTLAGRGLLRADPILFALRDPASYGVAALLLLLFGIAS